MTGNLADCAKTPCRNGNKEPRCPVLPVLNHSCPHGPPGDRKFCAARPRPSFRTVCLGFETERIGGCVGLSLDSLLCIERGLFPSEIVFARRYAPAVEFAY